MFLSRGNAANQRDFIVLTCGVRLIDKHTTDSGMLDVGGAVALLGDDIETKLSQT